MLHISDVEMDTASNKRTYYLLVLLCALIALLQNSHGAPNQRKRRSDGVLFTNSSTLATNSSLGTNSSIKDNTTLLLFGVPSAIFPTQTTCQKVLVNMTVDPPRTGCLPGLMIAVPMCLGSCNSYVHYLKVNPYKESQCSCCQATTYRLSKRTVTFQCGGTTETTFSYNIAAVIECGCSSCGSIPLIFSNSLS